MAARHFFLSGAKTEVAKAIREVEKQTAAEIVVAVRRSSGHYRHTDLYAGSIAALLAILVLLFDRHPFEVKWMPVEIAGAFAFAATWVANVDSVRRWLTSRKLMNRSVRTAARAAFYEMNIARKKRRTGVLVFVSMFERRVEIVPDTGVTASELGAEWSAALRRLEGSLRPRPNLQRFLAGLRAMAEPLARALPPQPDDADDLPNEPELR